MSTPPNDSAIKERINLLDYASRAYDLYLERRREIELRAQQLLGTAAIALGLLSWFLPSLINGMDKVQFLFVKPGFVFLKWAYFLGLFSYFVSALLALTAFRISKWIPGAILSWEDIDNYTKGDFDQASYAKKSLYAQQQGVELLKKQNAKKYNFLFAGFISLIIGILFVAFFSGLLFFLILG